MFYRVAPEIGHPICASTTNYLSIGFAKRSSVRRDRHGAVHRPEHGTARRNPRLTPLAQLAHRCRNGPAEPARGRAPRTLLASPGLVSTVLASTSTVGRVRITARQG